MAKKPAKKAVKEKIEVINTECAVRVDEDHAVVPDSVVIPEQKVPVPVVSVNYFGRYGNNLFQYVAARLFADKNGYSIITNPPLGFLSVNEPKICGIDPRELDTYTKCLVNVFNPIVKEQNTNFLFNGYFQDSSKFNPYRAQIKDMFNLKPIHKNTEDIVVHLRLTDYFWSRNKWVISPLWYINLIRAEKYKNCYIVVEPHPTNKEYLKYFNDIRGVKIITGNPAEEDFEFIRSFDRIICSNSTFCWWAAFLSDASKIYTFKPWIRDPKVNLANIPNGKAVPGEFFRIKKLENLDWTDYWKK